MKLFISVFLIIFSALFVVPAGSNAAFAQEDTAAGDAQADPEAASIPEEEQQPPSREDMMERLNNILMYRVDVREAIPGVLVAEDAEGQYVEFNGIRIEDLNDDSLMVLYRAVNQQVSLKNIENLQRTQRQMRDLKRIDDMNRQQRQLRQLNKPAVPKVPTVPKTRKY
jgi:hypothetical protein